LRNLRNIINLGDESIAQKALNALLNEKAIKKSLVLPFRYSTAYDEMRKVSSVAMARVSEACDIACNNIPKMKEMNTVITVFSLFIFFFHPLIYHRYI
jgi:hypothetical protein